MLENVFGRHNVNCIQLPQIKRDFWSYILGFYFNRVLKKKYLSWSDTRLLRKNQAKILKHISQEVDLIITFEFFLVPILKKGGKKIIWWSDATFNNLLNKYSYVTNVSGYCIKRAHQIQKSALASSNAVILSSDWAVESAITNYGTDRNKITKIPFASYFSVLPSKNEMEKIIQDKNTEVIRLLFIGIDWQRKGGEDAIKVLNSLNNRGYKALLYIVGCEIPDDHKLNKDIVALGFIDKGSTKGEEQIINLIKKACFLIVPSRAECFGIVFCEANSYGLPVITTNVDGIPSVVKNKINGAALPVENFVERATAFVTENLPGSDNYFNLCRASYNYYNSEMSWQKIERETLKVVKDIGFMAEVYYVEEPLLAD